MFGVFEDGEDRTAPPVKGPHGARHLFRPGATSATKVVLRCHIMLVKSYLIQKRTT